MARKPWRVAPQNFGQKHEPSNVLPATFTKHSLLKLFPSYSFRWIATPTRTLRRRRQMNDNRERYAKTFPISSPRRWSVQLQRYRRGRRKGSSDGPGAYYLLASTATTTTTTNNDHKKDTNKFSSLSLLVGRVKSYPPNMWFPYIAKYCLLIIKKADRGVEEK